MVKIPSASDYGRSSFGIDRDVRTRGSIASIGNAGAVGAAVAGLGRSISGLAGDFQAVADKQKAEKEQLDNFNTTARFYDTMGAINRDIDEQMKSAPADGTGVDKIHTDTFDKRTAAYLGGISDPKLRAQAEARVASARAQNDERGRSAMDRIRGQHYQGELNRFGEGAISGLKQNPDAWGQINDGMGELIAKSGLTPEQKSRIIDDLTPKLVTARIDGLRALGRNDEADAFAKEQDKLRAATVGVTPAAPAGQGAAPGPGARWQGPTQAVTDATRSVLSQQRARSVQELESDPKLKAYVFGLMKLETGEHPELALESLFNRAAMTGKSIRELVHNGFYGPVNRGIVKPEPQATTAYARAQAALNDVAAGSNYIGLRTDQGMENEHKFADANPGIGGKAKIGNEWFSHMGADGVKYAQNTQAQIDAISGGKAPPPGTYSAYNYARGQQDEATAHRQQVAMQVQQKAQYDAWENQTEFSIHDGKYGIADLERDRENGTITDAGDYMRLEKMIQSRNEDQSTLATAIQNVQGKDYVFDPGDKDDKKQVELYSQAMGVGDKIGKMDGDAISQATGIVNRTGMVPKDVIGPVQALYRSRDVGAFNYGMSVLGTLYQQNPDVVEKAFGTKMARAAGVYNELSQYTPADQIFRMLKADADPAQAANRERLRKDVDKALKDSPLTPQGIVDVFNSKIAKDGALGLGLSAEDQDSASGIPPLSPAQTSKLQYDYDKLFRENYVEANGDSDIAQKLTIQQLQRQWGETEVFYGSGPSLWRRMTGYGSGGRVMNYPPERFYQPVGGSFDWMKNEVERQLKGRGIEPSDWELVTTPDTVADVKGGAAPSYGIAYRREDGAWDVLRGDDNVPLQISFDSKSAKLAAAARGVEYADDMERVRDIASEAITGYPMRKTSAARSAAPTTNGPTIPTSGGGDDRVAMERDAMEAQRNAARRLRTDPAGPEGTIPR